MNPLPWETELKAELPPAHEPREVIALLGTVLGPRYSQTPIFEVLPFVQVEGRPPEKSQLCKGTPSTCAKDGICEMQIRKSVITVRFSICSKIGHPYWTNKTNKSLLLKMQLLNKFNEYGRDCFSEMSPSFCNSLSPQEVHSFGNNDKPQRLSRR